MTEPTPAAQRDGCLVLLLAMCVIAALIVCVAVASAR
jgi:hypothetical protein